MSLFKYCLPLLLLILSVDSKAQEIKWMTWEEAAKANEVKPQKIFVDIYTSWCGWCKKMDNSTFKDSSIIHQLNADFYAVKLNAEQKESIFWKGKEFKWVTSGRDGYNQLAFDLLDGQMSYPTFILMDESFSRILISPGYQDASILLTELTFAAGEHYKTTSWANYKALK